MFKVGDNVTFRGRKARVMNVSEMNTTRAGILRSYYIITEDEEHYDNVQEAQLTT